MKTSDKYLSSQLIIPTKGNCIGIRWAAGLGQGNQDLAACGFRDCTLGRGHEATGGRPWKEPAAAGWVSG
jgi:hypothetical protein